MHQARRRFLRYSPLDKMIAAYNRMFDEGRPYPFGTGLLWMESDPCAYCGNPDARSWDHIDPRVQGRGAGKWQNLVRSCTRCNKSKFSTPLLLYLVQRAHRRKRWGNPNGR